MKKTMGRESQYCRFANKKKTKAKKINILPFPKYPPKCQCHTVLDSEFIMFFIAVRENILV